MINALIKIVDSNDFKIKWTHEEKFEFRNFFFYWIETYWENIFSISAYQKKIIILLNKIFEGE
jgi:hypothetical protein